MGRVKQAELYERGGVVRRSDWRVICPCQRHRKSRTLARVMNGLSPWTRRCGALVLGVPLIFGFSVIPGLSTEIIAGRRLVQAPSHRSPHDLTLITPGVRLDYVAGALSSQQLSIERGEEEFFRSEVPFGGVIYAEARRNSLPPELVAAVVKAESDFRPRLCSGKKAQGLMQIIPSTGELMGVKNLYDPQENVRAGTKYLRYLFDRFDGEEKMVLAAYNAGEGNIARFGGIPPFRETRDYVQRVGIERARFHSRLTERLATVAELERSTKFAE
jgi:hypothetical protein